MKHRWLVVPISLAALLAAASLGGDSVAQQPSDDVLPLARAAADKAVDYLLANQKGGRWIHQPDGLPQNDLGCTALVATAILASDKTGRSAKAIAAAEAHLRANLDKLTTTYSIAFTIIFFERLKKSNGALISRLLSGQIAADGGWSYDCPPKTSVTDNSNTHLAVLALLVARRNSSMPAVEKALRAAEQRFRKTQQADGGWAYEIHGPNMKTTPSMTCVGLLGLAVAMDTSKRNYEVSLKSGAAGSSTDRKEQDYLRELEKFKNDPQIQAARKYLIGTLGGLAATTEHLTYVLWSVERIAFIYGPKEFYGTYDWYGAGCRVLFETQDKAKGFWNLDFRHGANVDTAFALLFLNRVNLLDDITVSLAGSGSIRQKAPAGAAASKKPTMPKGTPEEATALVKEMETAIGPRVDEILKKLESHTHSAYRDGLLDIIYSDKVRVSYKDRARDALANRMSFLDPSKLRQYLAEQDAELRLAAVIGAYRAEYKEMIPDLIDSLSDKDAKVSGAAYAALKGMTKQDHGRTPDGWKRWYEANKKQS